MGRRRPQKHRKKGINLPVDKLFSNSNEPIEFPTSPHKLKSPRQHSPKQSPQHSASPRSVSQSSLSNKLDSQESLDRSLDGEISIPNQEVTIELEPKVFVSQDLLEVNSEEEEEIKDDHQSEPITTSQSKPEEQIEILNVQHIEEDQPQNETPVECNATIANEEPIAKEELQTKESPMQETQPEMTLNEESVVETLSENIQESIADPIQVITAEQSITEEEAEVLKVETNHAQDVHLESSQQIATEQNTTIEEVTKVEEIVSSLIHSEAEQVTIEPRNSLFQYFWNEMYNWMQVLSV